MELIAQLDAIGPLARALITLCVASALSAIIVALVDARTPVRCHRSLSTPATKRPMRARPNEWNKGRLNNC